MATPATSLARTLDLPDGHIAYDDTGTGSLVILVPGMGDVRASYRFLAPRLVEAGYRVVSMDMRGHGASSVGWSDYRATAIASDVLALMRHLDAGPAILAGNSYGGAAVAYAAATDPGAVSALVLLDAFVRDLPQTLVQRLAIRALGIFGAGMWTSYYKSLYKTTPPADLPAYLKALKASLKEPGRFAATMAMAHGSHAAVEARLGDVRASALVVMGSKDPDFPDPAAEATRTAASLHGAARAEVAMIEGAGHYPHAERPDLVAAAILAFLAGAGVGAATGAAVRHGA